ncbi:hypothetical protein KCU67_g14444, partial [Aureobasidium melanogenum]
MPRLGGRNSIAGVLNVLGTGAATSSDQSGAPIKPFSNQLSVFLALHTWTIPHSGFCVPGFTRIWVHDKGLISQRLEIIQSCGHILLGNAVDAYRYNLTASVDQVDDLGHGRAVTQ